MHCCTTYVMGKVLFLDSRPQTEKQQPTVNNHHQSMWTLLVIQNNELKENVVYGSVQQWNIR